jgi:hypothetical protein
MTASGSSTGSTIGRPRPPDRESHASGAERGSAPGAAVIVASLHGRTGKTLLARVLADYFVLSGTRPLLFDTDVASQALRAAFPYDTVVVDLDATRDQMTLFDTLATRSPEPRVVDVSHHVFRKFFKVMLESDFVAEARARRVAPIVFCLADRTPDAYEEARLLRDRFDCALVLVENAHVGGPKDLTRRSPGYRALEGHDLRMTLPRLDGAIAEAIEDGVSLSDVISRPLSRDAAEDPGALPFDDREALRVWLIAIFRDIHRVIRAADAIAPPLLPADALI